MYSTFKQILNLYDRLNCEIQEMRNVVSGTVQISTVNSIGLHVLPPYLKSFLKEFPSVNARVEYRRANLVYDDVLHGNADIGLIAFPEPQKDLEVIPFRKRRTNCCHEPGTSLVPETDGRNERFTRFGIYCLLKKIFLLAKQLMKFWQILKSR